MRKKQIKLSISKRITVYRSKTGRFISKQKAKSLGIKGKYRQVTWYKGEIIKDIAWRPPKIKYMWRTTIAINYSWHDKYYSYKITAYAKKKKDLPKGEDLRKLLEEKFKEYRGYSIEELREYGSMLRVGEEEPTKKIRLDQKQINLSPITKDEYLRDGRRLKGKRGLKTFFILYLFWFKGWNWKHSSI